MASDELEERVSALEEQVRDLAGRLRATESDAAAARVLAGGADRDVSEIRTEIRDFRQATTASFNALREDLVDFRQDFGDLREHADGRFVEIGRGFADVCARLDGAAAGQQQIVDLIQTLIDDRGHQS